MNDKKNYEFIFCSSLCWHFSFTRNVNRSLKSNQILRLRTVDCCIFVVLIGKNNKRIQSTTHNLLDSIFPTKDEATIFFSHFFLLHLSLPNVSMQRTMRERKNVMKLNKVCATNEWDVPSHHLPHTNNNSNCVNVEWRRRREKKNLFLYQN